MPDITLNIVLVILTSSICWGIYKSRQCLKFRIVETLMGGITTYTPQVRISGVWFNIVELNDCPEISVNMTKSFLDIHDALVVLDKFTATKDTSIYSNKKLENNQKASEIE